MERRSQFLHCRFDASHPERAGYYRHHTDDRRTDVCVDRRGRRYSRPVPMSFGSKTECTKQVREINAGNSTSYTLTADQALTPGHSYIWYVGALANNSGALGWSKGLVFYVEPLNAPIITAPSSSVDTVQPNLTWSAANGLPPASYEVYLQMDTAKFPETFPDLDPHTTFYSFGDVNLAFGHTYHWWVGAVSNDGTIAWSKGVSFSLV